MKQSNSPSPIFSNFSYFCMVFNRFPTILYKLNFIYRCDTAGLRYVPLRAVCKNKIGRSVFGVCPFLLDFRDDCLMLLLLVPCVNTRYRCINK